jgi:hypothetical protein
LCEVADKNKNNMDNVARIREDGKKEWDGTTSRIRTISKKYFKKVQFLMSLSHHILTNINPQEDSFFPTHFASQTMRLTFHTGKSTTFPKGRYSPKSVLYSRSSSEKLELGQTDKTLEGR